MPMFLKPSFGIQAEQASLPFALPFLPNEQPEQLAQEVHPAGQDGAAVGERPAESNVSSFEKEVATRFMMPVRSKKPNASAYLLKPSTPRRRPRVMKNGLQEFIRPSLRVW